MNLRKLLMAAPLSMALAAAGAFGGFGNTVDEGEKTHFFQWFHLEKTKTDSGVQTYQPTSERFHDKVKVEIKAAASGRIESMKLTLDRAFIDGSEAPFARDIAKSFLETIDDRAALGGLINEIFYRRSGTATVIRSSGSEPKLPAEPSLPYGVFSGELKRYEIKLASGKMVRLDSRGGLFSISIIP